MALTINTNSSAATATMHLSKNNAALKKSLNRLSSGTRIVQPVDDAGGLAVSMKLESSIVRLAGAQKNIQNAQSFLEVQDGILSSAGKILNRMVELKGLSEDVMKNDSDKELITTVSFRICSCKSMIWHRFSSMESVCLQSLIVRWNDTGKDWQSVYR